MVLCWLELPDVSSVELEFALVSLWRVGNDCLKSSLRDTATVHLELSGGQTSK